MKKYILCVFAMLLFYAANAQNINKIEYFIDADPGYGAGIDVPISINTPITVNFNVNLTSFTDGFHIFTARAKDVNGNWGIVGIRPFYKETFSTALPPSIIAMEYFVDSDPGFGSGTAIPVVSNSPIYKEISFGMGSLANGTHKLTLRAKDVNNKWGIVSIQDFIVADNIIALGYTPANWCRTTNFSIPLTIAGTFNGGNVFTAQLSDINGSFASPTIIGTLTSTGSGTLTANVPNTIALGKGYKIRVVASSPNTIVSIERPFEIVAICCPEAPIVTKATGLACAGSTATLVANRCNGTVLWNTGATTTSISVSPAVNTVYTATCTASSCTSSGSNNLTVEVIPLPASPTLSASKYGTNITKTWDKRFGGSGDETLFDILPMSDGSYILGGYSSSGATGDLTESSRGGNDFLAIKIDATGNKVWDKHIGGSGNDFARKIFYNTVDANSYTMFGYSNSPISSDKTQSNYGGYDFWGISLNDAGNTVRWNKRYGGSSDEVLYVAMQNTDGTFLIGGRSNSPKDNNEVTQDSRGDQDMFIMKIDANGNRL